MPLIMKINCWNCGSKDSEIKEHCLSCDLDKTDCQCEEKVLWEYIRCNKCGASI